jgi:integrase
VQAHLKSYGTLKGRVRSLVEAFGDTPMEKLTARDYEKYRARRLKGRKDKRGKVEDVACKPSTVNRDLQVLKNMFEKALTYDFISREAFDRIAKIKKLREENTVIRYLSREEEASLLKACLDLGRENSRYYGHLYPIVLTALRTGMRKGEILALRREDVNLGKRIIHVVKSKSGKRRDVPVPADLLGVLRAHLGSHCMEQVFWHGSEKAETYRDVKKSFKRALGKAGITNFRFHDCRHHYASHFVMDGGNILHLQKILGHQSVQMTERYAHLAPDFIEAATRILDMHNAAVGHTEGTLAFGGKSDGV